jgi:hypothetical protein
MNSGGWVGAAYMKEILRVINDAHAVREFDMVGIFFACSSVIDLSRREGQSLLKSGGHRRIDIMID